jgi:hypothetical protein
MLKINIDNIELKKNFLRQMIRESKFKNIDDISIQCLYIMIKKSELSLKKIDKHKQTTKAFI